MIENLRIGLLIFCLIPAFFITRIYWKNYDYFLSRKEKYGKSAYDLLPKKVGSSLALFMGAYYGVIVLCGFIFTGIKKMFGF